MRILQNGSLLFVGCFFVFLKQSCYAKRNYLTNEEAKQTAHRSNRANLTKRLFALCWLFFVFLKQSCYAKRNYLTNEEVSKLSTMQTSVLHITHHASRITHYASRISHLHFPLSSNRLHKKQTRIRGTMKQVIGYTT